MANDDVLVIWDGGPWDGAELIQSRSTAEGFFGIVVSCPPVRTELAKMHKFPTIEDAKGAKQVALYHFDSEFTEGVGLYLRYLGSASLAHA